MGSTADRLVAHLTMTKNIIFILIPAPLASTDLKDISRKIAYNHAKI